jgi:hypothetical protein
MAQRQYVAKPGKILAEQYDPAADPLQAGVHTCVNLSTPNGEPHVHGLSGTMPWVLTAGDWILFSVAVPGRCDGAMSAAEFAETYGDPGGQAPTTQPEPV